MKAYQRAITHGILSAVSLAGTLGLTGCIEEPGKEVINGTVISEKPYSSKDNTYRFTLSTEKGLKVLFCTSVWNDPFLMDGLINLGYKVKVRLPKDKSSDDVFVGIRLEHIAEVQE